MDELNERFKFDDLTDGYVDDWQDNPELKKLGAALGNGAVLHREELWARLLGLVMLEGAVYGTRGRHVVSLIPELEDGVLLGAAKEQLVGGSQLEDRDRLFSDLVPTLSYLGRFVLPIDVDASVKPTVSFGQVVCARCQGAIDRPESCYCPLCGKALTPTPRLWFNGDEFVYGLHEQFRFRTCIGGPWNWFDSVDYKKLGAALGNGAVLYREELWARLLGLLMVLWAVHASGDWVEDALPGLEEGMLLGAAKEQLVGGSQLEDRDRLFSDLAPTLSYLGRFALPVDLGILGRRREPQVD